MTDFFACALSYGRSSGVLGETGIVGSVTRATFMYLAFVWVRWLGSFHTCTLGFLCVCVCVVER